MVRFFPEGYELDKKAVGVAKRAKKTSGFRDQMVSLGKDGQILFWDLCFIDNQDKRIPLANLEFDKIQWKAFLSLQLFKQDLTPLETCFSFFDTSMSNPDLFIGCESGQIIKVNFEPKPQDDPPKPDPIRSSFGPKSFSPVLSLESSPFRPSLLLSVSELSFHLFLQSPDPCPDPLFASPPILFSKLTCGSFSKSRPGVFFIGREDGVLDIWDLTELVSMPTQMILVAAVGVQSVHSSFSSKLVGVCDKEGCLHLLRLPQGLSKKKAGEEELLEAFLGKEGMKARFYAAGKEVKEIEGGAGKGSDSEEVGKEEEAGKQIESAIIEDAYSKFVEEQLNKF